MTVNLPGLIGRYRIQAVIGTGGFATVYRGVDERLDTTVAVKVLAENHSHDPDLRERFLREGQVLRRIDGPHVVAVHDLGETDRGQPYLVLEHAGRGNLAERASQRRAAGWRPEATDLLHVAGALADALDAVHASSLVHRDVAPRNLLIRSARAAGTHVASGLLDADERLLLADLGLSKDLATVSGLTVGGGTAGYTPPEQRTGLATVDAAADVWAASALTVWLALGEPPDESGRWREQLAGVGWPPALAQALSQGLAPSPADRYERAPVWYAAIREALTPAPTTSPTLPSASAAPLGPAAPLPPAPDNPARRPWPTIVAAAACGLAVGAGAALVIDGNDDDRSGRKQAEEELAGGRVRVEATDGGASLGMVGPRQLAVGEEAVFSAEPDGVDELVWFGPDGVVHVDEPDLAVVADSVGIARVTVAGVNDEGRSVMATRTLDVVDPDGN